MEEIKLKVDVMEPEKIFNILDREGIKYEKEPLPIGDFIFNEICIERKTMADLVNSIRTGHLQKQLLQMQDNYKFCYLILVGNFKDVAFHPHITNWTVEHHVGTLASIAVRYNVKMINVDNDTQLVKLIQKLCDKQYNGKTPDIMKTELVLLKNKYEFDYVPLRMLMCIPDINLQRAIALNDHIDVKFVTNDGKEVTKDFLMDIPGIGEILADKILKSIKSEGDESGSN